MRIRPGLSPRSLGTPAWLRLRNVAAAAGGLRCRARRLARTAAGAFPPIAAALATLTRRHPDERDAVARVARALVEPAGLAQVAETVVTQGCKALGVDSVALWLADEDARELTLLAHRGIPPYRAAAFRRLGYGAGLLTTRAAVSGGIQEVRDVRTAGQEHKITRELAGQDSMRSLLAVPLKARGHLVAVMTCACRQPNRYGERERSLAATLADLFAAAIERAQLAETRHDLVLERLQAVLSGMGQITAPAEASLDGVLRQIASVARGLAGAQHAAVELLGKTREVEMFIPVGVGEDDVSTAGLRAGVDGFLEALLRESRPGGARAARRGPHSAEVSTEEVVRDGYLAVPILYQRRLLGGLYLRDKLDRAEFTQEDRRVIEVLAAHAAVAIENARLYTSARDALRMREEFLSAAAHELKTPVTALRGYAQILQSLPDYGSALERQARQAIGHSSDRISRLVHGLLEVSALEAGRYSLNRSAFDLSQLAFEVVSDVQVTTSRHRLVLHAPRPVVVEADRDRLAEVLSVLLDNAVKFSPKGGRIDVSVRAARGPHGPEAVLSVRDHGVGIPADRQPHVFEPLYEPQPSGSPGYVGIVGLGLYLSKRLVEGHGGRIWFESAEAKGSTFWVALPTAR